MDTKKYKRKKQKQELTEQERLFNMIWKHQEFRQFLGSNYQMDGEQAQLLCKIFSEEQNRTREEWVAQIYDYGSTIKSQDLAARQMFLWLFELARHKEQPQQNADRWQRAARHQNADVWQQEAAPQKTDRWQRAAKKGRWQQAAHHQKTMRQKQGER